MTECPGIYLRLKQFENGKIRKWKDIITRSIYFCTTVFPVIQRKPCYVDQGSHLGLAFCRDTMGIGEICPRGLLNLRETLTAPGLRFLLEWDGLTKPVPVTGISLSTDAGGVTVSGVAAVGETVLRMRLQVTAASFNYYRMRLEMSSCGKEYVTACRVFGAGCWAAAFTHREITELPDRTVVFAASQTDRKAEQLSGISEDWCASWRWSGLAPMRLLVRPCRPGLAD